MVVKLKSAGQQWAEFTFNKATAEQHPTPDVATSLVNELSNFNPGAVGQNGTVGIGRFLPEHAAELGVDPGNPYQSIDAVLAIDKQNLDLFGGNRDLATAAFFVGPEQVSRAVQTGENLPDEILFRVNRVNENAPEFRRMMGEKLLGAPKKVAFSDLSETSLVSDQDNFLDEVINTKLKERGVKVV